MQQMVLIILSDIYFLQILQSKIKGQT